MIFLTDNSTYEIDPANRRIRRLEGTNDPTARQGNDGDWKNYAAISSVTIGDPVVIVWQILDDRAKGTNTSPVRQIINALN